MPKMEMERVHVTVGMEMATFFMCAGRMEYPSLAYRRMAVTVRRDIGRSEIPLSAG